MGLFQKLTTAVLILGVLWMTHGTNGLRCYKCFALDCPDKPETCYQVKSFVLKELPSVYYNFESNVPQCPSPTGEHSEASWLEVQQSSRDACGQESAGEATCVLGRFRVTTVPDGASNVTSHGTVTGCAKRKLLTYMKTAKLKQKCSMIKSTSPKTLGMTHYLEVEHCSTGTEMCTEDWCVSPKETVIRPFLSSKTNSDKGSFFLKAGFIAFTLIGAIITLCTFLGMKYDTSRLMRNKN